MLVHHLLISMAALSVPCDMGSRALLSVCVRALRQVEIKAMQDNMECDT